MTRPYNFLSISKGHSKATPFLGRDKIKLMVRYDYRSFLQAQQYHLEKFMGDNCLIFLFL